MSPNSFFRVRAHDSFEFFFKVMELGHSRINWTEAAQLFITCVNVHKPKVLAELLVGETEQQCLSVSVGGWVGGAI